MNARWKEIAADILKQKLKDIYSQFSSTWWKDKTIEFDFKQKMMMEPDRIWFVECKSSNQNPSLLAFIVLSRFYYVFVV